MEGPVGAADLGEDLVGLRRARELLGGHERERPVASPVLGDDPARLGQVVDLQRRSDVRGLGHRVGVEGERDGHLAAAVAVHLDADIGAHPTRPGRQHDEDDERQRPRRPQLLTWS